MIYAKDHKTCNIFDPFSHLGPKRLKMLTDSWSGLFRKELLPNLPIHLVSKHYERDMGRPTKELYAMMGVTILQQMKDLTDDETVRQFAFNTEWHYALDVSGVSDTSAYICLKTLWNMRELMSKYGLEDAVFTAITAHLAKVFSCDMDKQRLDSTHIFSNMKHLGRIGLFIQTIKGFLTNLKRNHKLNYIEVDGDIINRYMTKQGASGFAMVKPSDSASRLVDLAEDLFALVEQFKDVGAVTTMSSYHKLVRLLQEQCVTRQGEGEDAVIEAKAAKEIASDSMQNPSDPDAGYDGHKGQGYQAQVMETYGGDEVTAPVLGTVSEDKLGLDTFQMDEHIDVIACPAGHKPECIRHKNDRNTAIFAVAVCLACPCKDRCPAVEGKKGFYLRYTAKQVRIAVRRAYEKTEEFRERYRWRAGVEGANSLGKQKTGLGKLRVRGMQAVRFAVTLKWLGVNILRASACQNSENNPESVINIWSILRISACRRTISDTMCRICGMLMFFPLEVSHAQEVVA